MTGLPSTAPADLGEPEGGAKYDWQSPDGLFVASSLHCPSELGRSALKRQNLRIAEVLPDLCVGTTGFEPATPCTPCKCATGLRYVPNVLILLNQWGAKLGKKSAQAASGGLTFFYEPFL